MINVILKCHNCGGNFSRSRARHVYNLKHHSLRAFCNNECYKKYRIFNQIDTKKYDITYSTNSNKYTIDYSHLVIPGIQNNVNGWVQNYYLSDINPNIVFDKKYLVGPPRCIPSVSIEDIERIKNFGIIGLYLDESNDCA